MTRGLFCFVCRRTVLHVAEGDTLRCVGCHHRVSKWGLS